METYHGYVRTPADAIKLFEACRLGLLPRVQRRLSEKERQSISSGSVFVWDEREAGMRRWTDGKSWSASRVSGSFLTYREMEGKRGSGFGNSRRGNARTPDGGRISDEDPDGEPEGYRYKADGLMKQSFSITTSQGQHLHLISYYSRPHPGAPEMPQPSSDPQLRHIVPAKGMYPESSLHDANPPALTRTPMPPYNQGPPPEPAAYGYTWGAPAPAWMSPWPPSPSGTPPWVSHKMSPEVKGEQPPPPPPPPPPHHMRPVLISPIHAGHHHPAHHPSHPLAHPPPGPLGSPHAHPNYPKVMHHPYEGERLPPPSAARAYHQQPSPAASSPLLQHLQNQAAQAVMIDPRLAATSARNPQGPLPAMSVTRGLTPPRTHSASPPRASGPDLPHAASKQSSISAILLHPTPSNSEPNSANPASNSTNSSPRTLNAGSSVPPAAPDMFTEDARAIRSLDRKFCI